MSEHFCSPISVHWPEVKGFPKGTLSPPGLDRKQSHCKNLSSVATFFPCPPPPPPFPPPPPPPPFHTHTNDLSILAVTQGWWCLLLLVQGSWAWSMPGQVKSKTYTSYRIGILVAAETRWNSKADLILLSVRQHVKLSGQIHRWDNLCLLPGSRKKKSSLGQSFWRRLSHLWPQRCVEFRENYHSFAPTNRQSSQNSC